MSIEFLVAIANNTNNRTIVSPDTVKISGTTGALEGTVQSVISPHGVGSQDWIRLHVSSDGAWFSLDGANKLQRFNPLVETAVLQVERLK